jgi:hypothetical protein
MLHPEDDLIGTLSLSLASQSREGKPADTGSFLFEFGDDIDPEAIGLA